MISGLIPNSQAIALRGVLVTAALLGLVFPALAAGLHVHHDHVADDCDLCLQLDHLVFAAAEAGSTAEAAATTGTGNPRKVDAPCRALPTGDPARAPPALS
jgi:hypothetical protein